MSVALHPNRNLGFRRPLTQVVKRSLTITNQNTQPVAFKVKTTAPKLYCVRPNSGRVEPGESVDVSVMLQPLKDEPPLNSKCKDKFLVQTTLITPEKETMALHDLWLSPDINEDGVVHQQKLRVIYLPAEDGPLEEEDENVPPPASRGDALGASDFYETVRAPNVNGHAGLPAFVPPVPPVPTPADPEADPQPQTTADEHMSREHSNEYHEGEALDVPPVPPQPQSREVPVSDAPTRQPPSPHHSHHEHEESEHLPVPPWTRAPPVHASPPPSTIETVYVENPLNEELLAKYREAQEEIDRLRATITTMSVAPTSEIRSRRNRTISDAASTAETDVQTVIEEPPYHQDGVPLQVVVIVALGVFITTYLFF